MITYRADSLPPWLLHIDEVLIAAAVIVDGGRVRHIVKFADLGLLELLSATALAYFLLISLLLGRVIIRCAVGCRSSSRWCLVSISIFLAAA